MAGKHSPYSRGPASMVTTWLAAQPQVQDCWFHEPSSFGKVSCMPLLWIQIGITIQDFLRHGFPESGAPVGQVSPRSAALLWVGLPWGQGLPREGLT